jgi:hypothetical protein
MQVILWIRVKEKDMNASIHNDTMSMSGPQSTQKENFEPINH